MISVNVASVTAFNQLSSQLEKTIKSSMDDVTDDLLRVATERAPVKSKTLEQSGTKIPPKKSGGVYVSEVSFRAKKKGFNYAIKMDSGTYKLGDKSLQKSKRGVRSVFTNQTLKVGKGYLTDTAEKCEDGYKKYISEQLDNEIRRQGFRG